jgi:hypothetical protein
MQNIIGSYTPIGNTMKRLENMMRSFEEYVHAHAIDPVQLSIFAGVRYLTIWNAMRGNPITSENARKIKRAVMLITGIPYIGAFTLLPQEGQPTLPLRRLRVIK